MNNKHSMYHNEVDKNFTNRQKVFSTLERNSFPANDKELDRNSSQFQSKNDLFTVEQKIYQIFNAPDYIYKADVTIVTDSGTMQKRIVAKKRDKLITMDNEYIDIKTIRDIYK